jgi:hypothetical protein
VSGPGERCGAVRIGGVQVHTALQQGTNAGRSTFFDRVHQGAIRTCIRGRNPHEGENRGGRPGSLHKYLRSEPSGEPGGT